MNFKPSILFIDQDQSKRQLFVNLFKSFYHVRIANSPEEGLDMLEKSSFDLIIREHNTQERNNLSFLAKVSRLYPRIKKMILNAHLELEESPFHINYVALLQPWNRFVLKEKIDMVLTN